MRTLIPLVLFAAACAPRGEVPDVRVASATLVNLDSNTVAVLAGASAGDALLVYTTTDGSSGAIPVAVTGGTVGAVVEIDVDLNPGSDVPLDLSDADPDLTLDDLFGTYRGSTWGLTLGFGGAGMTLRNKHGVRLSDVHWTAGVGIYGGFEWLRIRRGGDEGQDDDTGVIDDSGVPVPPPSTGGGGGGGCNGGSASPPDTDDTDPADTDPGDTDTDPGDTDTEPGDTDPEPGTEPDPVDPDPSTSSSGCSCNGDSSSDGSSGDQASSGSGCGDGSGCDDGSNCAVGGGRPPMLALALIIGLLRRRD